MAGEVSPSLLAPSNTNDSDNHYRGPSLRELQLGMIGQSANESHSKHSSKQNAFKRINVFPMHLPLNEST